MLKYGRLSGVSGRKRCGNGENGNEVGLGIGSIGLKCGVHIILN